MKSISEAEEVFEKQHATTKEDILNRIKMYEEAIKKNEKEDRYHSAAFYGTLKELLRTFKERIEDSVLFKCLETGWLYECVVSYWGAALEIEHAEILGLNSEGTVDYELDQSYELIRVDCKTLTPEDYGSRYGVDQGTVRQWIRRGKIRTAIKKGGEWRIPELTEPPKRGYKSAVFRWDKELSDLPDEYKYLKDYESVWFSQDEQDKAFYHISLFKKGGITSSKQMTVGTKEREKLELFCIAHPDIQYVARVEDGIFFEIMNFNS